MVKEKFIVRVSASFETRDALFETLRKYAQNSDDQFAYWDEFSFTTSELPECDGLLILNTPAQRISADCYPEQVIAFMMEPGIQSKHPWMFQQLDQYHKVYSPVRHSANTVLSHGFLGWYVLQDHNRLHELDVPPKPKLVSCIASDLDQLPGHRLRLDFIEQARHRFPEMNLYGKGSHFIPDKMDGLLPYRYSLAIENSSQPYYFTEKINDCFLAYTVPIYYGCSNIGDYFPEGSYVQIDIRDPSRAIEVINEVLQSDDWQNRLEAVKGARKRVLQRYQPLAAAATILREIPRGTSKKKVTIVPVRASLLRRLKHHIYQLISPQQ